MTYISLAFLYCFTAKTLAHLVTTTLFSSYNNEIKYIFSMNYRKLYVYTLI